MPLLDVSIAFNAIEFADIFTVLRRRETVDQSGRSQQSMQKFPQIVGTLYPTGENSLVREPDYSNSLKSLTIVTNFRLQMTSPGFQPDLVVWNGDYFVVRNINDFARFGAGMIVAECSSIDSIDFPPFTPTGPSPIFWDNGGALALFPEAAIGWPTDPTMLNPGDVWNNFLEVAIVPDENGDQLVPEAAAVPIYFGTPVADNLLGLGGSRLQLVQPEAGSLILWNNNGAAAIG